MKNPVPFRAVFDPDRIADLRRRIEHIIWPHELDHGDADPWDYGVPATCLKDLVTYWANGFEWDVALDFFNRYPQFMMDVEGLDTHFVHVRSCNKNAVPLLMMHGWPGSVFEFWDVIPRLTRPEDFGGSASDAFHVVCPSLTGYGYSAPARMRGMNPKAIAARHDKLMHQLGYDHYVVQGGDWGALIARRMPDICADSLIGVHYNLTMPTPPSDISDPETLLNAQEREQMALYRAREFSVSGYSHEQGTRPQTLGYALNDSPVGLAAWIAEKFVTWSDNGERFLTREGRDWLLSNISLYWMSGSIASSIRLYREFFDQFFAGDVAQVPCPVPTGITDYPKEIWRSPRSWAEREYNLVHWNRAQSGGHFAALEEPQFFAEELWRFKAALNI